VALTSPHHRTRTVKGLFDSGADITHLDPQWMAQLRVTDQECIPWQVRVASGATADGRLTLLDARLDNTTFRMPVVFLAGLPTDLFGRVGLFDRFKIDFDPEHAVTSFTFVGHGIPWATVVEAHWNGELAKVAAAKAAPPP